ncbi:hypothetical protein [Pseudomonas syringae]|uniref:Uncharacterized protein n=1 Tax=Pseudomonas syringae TaxID=317 RepID=A0A085V932_PSESX|nr:hypothetical protein [Pseudomonas syringae]KFE51945.1 hypothetical protein IV01_22745 [Pseudomonas syringae]
MTEAKSNAVITTTNLVSFTGVSRDQRTDILNMLMYADHFAGQIDRRDRWAGWTLHYRKQLQFARCELISRFDHSPTVINNVRELEYLNIGVKGINGTAGLEDLARRSFKAVQLKQFADHFFQFGSGAGAFSRFQIAPCENIGEGTVVIAVCALQVSTETFSGGLFNLDEDREMVVRLEGGLYRFSEQAYSERRDYIRSRLSGVRREKLRLINL